jgi:hypothetical protein
MQVSIMPLLRCFGGDGVMKLFNALFTEKRVLFLGHNQPVLIYIA